MTDNQIQDIRAIDLIIKRAMRTDETWARYVEIVGAPEARGHLIRLRADLKAQRTVNAARLGSKELPQVEYQQWLARSTSFDRALSRRLASIQVNPGAPAANRTSVETSSHYKRMHKADVRLVETLAMAIHRYLEDDDLGEDVLEDALDADVDLGKNGVMPLRDAIEAGLFPGTPVGALPNTTKENP